jgi:DNA repair ATPase RecN
MRVKIAYTVELEEVESEVSEIMSRASLDLDFAYQEVVRVQMDLDTNVGDLNSKIQQLDTIRRKMAKADQILSDCQSILEGLRETKQQIEEQQNEIQDG